MYLVSYSDHFIYQLYMHTACLSLCILSFTLLHNNKILNRRSGYMWEDEVTSLTQTEEVSWINLAQDRMLYWVAVNTEVCMWEHTQVIQAGKKHSREWHMLRLQIAFRIGRQHSTTSTGIWKMLGSVAVHVRLTTLRQKVLWTKTLFTILMSVIQNYKGILWCQPCWSYRL